jgi:hypothetical protein
MQDFAGDPFFQYPQTNYPTSEGYVAMPILYFDDSNVMAFFFVDLAKAQALVAREGFKAINVGMGKALAGVAFYEYRHTSIGPYNECGVAIAVTPPDTRLPWIPLYSLLRHPDKNRIGFHILDLPVTTAAACAAGREIWGYPKFVAEIGFSQKGREFSGSVTDPATSSPIFKLSGRMGFGVPAPLFDLVLYSRLEGKALRATAITRGGGALCLPGDMKLEISESSNRMAQNLRALGLENSKPAFVSRTHSLKLRLNAGAVLP